MNKTVLVVLLTALAPVGVFAVDGQVLINQSTVMAQGGFPFVIATPGSYKLSGNLTAPLNANGIVVSTSNVTLDLNGFFVQCSGTGAGFVSCISAAGGPAVHDVVVRNGSVSATLVGTPAGPYSLSGVNFNAIGQGIQPAQVTLEDLQVRVAATFFDFGFNTSWGPNSIVKGNTFTSNIAQAGLNAAGCPSLIVQNVNATGGVYDLSLSGCLVSNNLSIN